MDYITETLGKYYRDKSIGITFTIYSGFSHKFDYDLKVDYNDLVRFISRFGIAKFDKNIDARYKN